MHKQGCHSWPCRVCLRMGRLLGEGHKGCSPGLMTMTSMPKGVSSRRSPSDIVSSPALLAAYAPCSSETGLPWTS